MAKQDCVQPTGTLGRIANELIEDYDEFFPYNKY
jgi:hypothetical protein